MAAAQLAAALQQHLRRMGPSCSRKLSESSALHTFAGAATKALVDRAACILSCCCLSAADGCSDRLHTGQKRAGRSERAGIAIYGAFVHRHRRSQHSQHTL